MDTSNTSTFTGLLQALPKIKLFIADRDPNEFLMIQYSFNTTENVLKNPDYYLRFLDLKSILLGIQDITSFLIQSINADNYEQIKSWLITIEEVQTELLFS